VCRVRTPLGGGKDYKRMSWRPPAKSSQVSDEMRRMPEQSTGLEMSLRRALFKKGLRYRVKYPVPGASRRSIDIAFPGKKVAVFLDGCFWHGCSEHRTIPKHNYEWWKSKIEENRSRDQSTNGLLHTAGWIVLRFWEHDSIGKMVEDIHRLVTLQVKNKD
jgi:DNA mismatch endonuclease, patch repair protein